MEIENIHPYPGVRYVGTSKRNPWLAIISRKNIKFHWGKLFSTPEAARDAIAAKLKESGLKPLRVRRRKIDFTSQDKTSEMDRAIDFEDRLTEAAA
jgi:hypothetical protein